MSFKTRMSLFILQDILKNIDIQTTLYIPIELHWLFVGGFLQKKVLGILGQFNQCPYNDRFILFSHYLPIQKNGMRMHFSIADPHFQTIDILIV